MVIRSQSVHVPFPIKGDYKTVSDIEKMGDIETSQKNRQSSRINTLFDLFTEKVQVEGKTFGPLYKLSTDPNEVFGIRATHLADLPPSIIIGR